MFKYAFSSIRYNNKITKKQNFIEINSLLNSVYIFKLSSQSYPNLKPWLQWKWWNPLEGPLLLGQRKEPWIQWNRKETIVKIPFKLMYFFFFCPIVRSCISCSHLVWKRSLRPSPQQGNGEPSRGSVPLCRAYEIARFNYK